MKRYNKDQRGFGSVEVLLLVLIIVIVVSVGWFVYHSNQKASDTIDKGNQSNANAHALNHTSTETADSAGTRAKEAATRLMVFSKANSKSTLSSFVDKHVNDSEFTAAFKKSADSGNALASGSVNPIYCSATVPTGFKVASSTLTGNSAVVVLDQVSSSTTAEAQVPKLTLTYANQAWSVDQYACVANPSS